MLTTGMHTHHFLYLSLITVLPCNGRCDQLKRYWLLRKSVKPFGTGNTISLTQVEASAMVVLDVTHSYM